MSAKDDISVASLERTIATGRLMALIASLINTCFVIMACRDGVWLRVELLLVMQCSLMSCWFLFRAKYYARYVPWLFVATAWLSMNIAIFTNGGGINNVMVLWFALLVCVASFVGDFRFAVQWFLIALLTVLLIFGLELLGFEVHNWTPESRRYSLAVLHVFAQIICAGAFVLGYQRQLLEYQQRVTLIVNQLDSEIVRREIAEHASLKACNEKDQFLRNVSHVFRKPLNGIVDCSEQLLRDHADQPELVLPLQSINRDGRNLHYFVSELLMLDATLALPLELSDARPAKVLHEVVVAVEAEAKRFDLTLALTIDPACFAIVESIDVARLSLALNNLLLFTVRQSVAGVIRVHGQCIDDAFIVSITDCAPAYNEAMRNSLFGAHYDLVLDNKKDLPSSAFSLKIAAVIVALHGGSLAVTNLELGNKITLKLPLSAPPVDLP
ncbi:MAG: hypothetical protein U5M23_03985 [Marinagarivorans sp.]|nr:hypothetical protein [Marinagarivorans sp.]